MSQEVVKFANSAGAWITASFIVILVIMQAILYARHAFKTAEKINLDKKVCNKAFKVGMVTSIGPVIAIFIVMVGLMAVIGGPMAWMRLSIIGAAPTELTAAPVGAEAIGVEFGGPDYDLRGLSASWWTMAVNGIGWLLFVGLFASRLEVIREKVSGNDAAWLAVITVAATLGAFGYLTSQHIVAGGGTLISAIVGAVVMVALGIAMEKMPKLRVLKEYSLGISMLVGVIMAVLLS